MSEIKVKNNNYPNIEKINEENIKNALEHLKELPPVYSPREIEIYARGLKEGYEQGKTEGMREMWKIFKERCPMLFTDGLCHYHDKLDNDKCNYEDCPIAKI